MPEKKKPAPPPRIKPRVLQINPNTAPSIQLLNDVVLFQRRIRFDWIRRRGTTIEAGFSNGRTAQWFSATDLRTFTRSQDILFNTTGYLIPTPTQHNTKAEWEPVCQLIRNIADMDATEEEPALKDEFEGIIRSTWVRSGRTVASTAFDFFEILKECQTEGRKVVDHPPRSCVWAGGDGEESQHFTWVHQHSLVEWLSAPRGKGKNYPWDDVRKALYLLNFQPRKLCRSFDSEKLHVRVWRGPLELLTDDDSKGDTAIA